MDTKPGDVPNEADFFLIFQVLRESRAIISQGFTRRVRIRLQKLVDENRLSQPSFLDILNQLGMDSIALVSDSISGQQSIRGPIDKTTTEENE